MSLHRLVLAQNKKELLTNWWNEGKLEASEELGDMVSAAGDKDMALKIYQLCGASGKVGLLAGAPGNLQALPQQRVHSVCGSTAPSPLRR